MFPPAACGVIPERQTDIDLTPSPVDDQVRHCSNGGSEKAIVKNKKTAARKFGRPSCSILKVRRYFFRFAFVFTTFLFFAIFATGLALARLELLTALALPAEAGF